MMKHPDHTENIDNAAHTGFNIKVDTPDAGQSYMDKIVSCDLSSSIVNHTADTAGSKRVSNFPLKMDTITSEEDSDDTETTSKVGRKPLGKQSCPKKCFKRTQKVDLDCVNDRVENEEERILNGVENCGLKRKTASIIWSFMVKQSPIEATCTLCRKSFRIHNGSTSSMIKHLKIFHSSAFEKAERGNRVGATTFRSHQKNLHTVLPPAKVTKLNSSSLTTKHNDYLANVIASELFPCSLVESVSFKKYVDSLNPKVVLPNKQTVEENISKLHKSQQNILQKQIDESPDISISIEIWTYRERRQYMTITGHFISKTWEHESVILKTVLLDTRTSTDLGTNIANKLRQILQDWSILDKVTCIVSDNSELLASAVAQLGKPHVQCVAHALNMIMDASLKAFLDFESIVEKVRDIANFFEHSVEAAEKLVNYQTSESKVALKLILDSESDWISTYKMFKCYADLQSTLKAVLVQLYNEDLLLERQELALVNHYIQVLEPFVLAAEDMSSDGYMILSKSLPVFEILQQMVSSYECPDSSQGENDPLTALTRDLSGHLSLVLENNVRNITNLLSFTATLLDPRFKHIVLRDRDVLQRIEQKLQLLMETNDSDENEHQNFEYGSHLTTSDIESNSLWSSFDKTVKESVSESPVNELHRYIEERPVTRRENPLLYWKEREPLYPKLCSIVKKFLSIPATSVPPKQVFSGEEKKKMIRRTFLEESNLDSILFLSTSRIEL